MRKTNITLACDAEKLSALEQYMTKKNVRLEDELDKQIQKLYEKHVPPIVRDYIDARVEPDAPGRTRPSRSRPAQAGAEEN